MKKKNKILIGGLAAAILVVGGLTFYGNGANFTGSIKNLRLKEVTNKTRVDNSIKKSPIVQPDLKHAEETPATQDDSSTISESSIATNEASYTKEAIQTDTDLKIDNYFTNQENTAIVHKLLFNAINGDVHIDPSKLGQVVFRVDSSGEFATDLNCSLYEDNSMDKILVASGSVPKELTDGAHLLHMMPNADYVIQENLPVRLNLFCDYPIFMNPDDQAQFFATAVIWSDENNNVKTLNLSPEYVGGTISSGYLK